MRTILFGGTDLTLALAERIEEHLVGVVGIPAEFRISYEPGGATNQRYADVVGWAQDRGLDAVTWDGPDSVLPLVERQTPEWGLAAGWYYLLPRRLRERFPRGVAGLHASLLPRYRGAAPLNWALLRGEERTGISLFQLADEVDDGLLYGQAEIPIGPRTTVGELVAASEAAGIDLVVDALAHPDRPLEPQVGPPTWCLARRPDDSRIDWTRPAVELDRLVRASTRPYAGAFAPWGDRRLRVWAAEVGAEDVAGAPGQVWRAPGGGVGIVTGDGVLRIVDAEVDGEDALPALRRASMQRLG